jgi:hypothetical protein
MHANEQGGEERRATNNFIDFLYIYGQFVSLHPHVASQCSSSIRLEKTLKRRRKTNSKMRKLLFVLVLLKSTSA